MVLSCGKLRLPKGPMYTRKAFPYFSPALSSNTNTLEPFFCISLNLKHDKVPKLFFKKGIQQN